MDVKFSHAFPFYKYKGFTSTNKSVVVRKILVFPIRTQQADMYKGSAQRIINNVLEGYNGTVFAYGQTGTGKTFRYVNVEDPPYLAHSYAAWLCVVWRE